MILAEASSLRAQTAVPDGANLAALPAPVSTDIWNLQGNATLFDPAVTAPSFALTLPVGAPGLTINGVASGSTITLNDGAGHFGFFNNATASAVTLNLSDVTITGGLRTTSAASGGAIGSSGALALNTSGAVTLSNNATTATNANGGAISATALTINGNNTTLAIASNTAGVSGGAVSSGNVIVAGSYNSILIANNSNSSAGGSFNGGAFFVQGTLTIDATIAGDFTVTHDTEASNGAFWASQGVIIAPTTTVGGTMSFTGDAGNAGGAIYTDSAITIGGSYGNILITGNTGRAGRGGAFRAASAITIDTSVTGTMAVTNNTGVGDGGALVATGGSVTITGSYGGIDFSHNTSGTDTTGTLAVPGVQCGGGGGAICAGNGNLTISATVADTMTFADNTAVRGNGGALAANNGSVILDAGPGNISLTGNTAVGTTVAGNGGAIYSPGMTTITGSALTLSGNTATAGAGGAVYTVGDFTLTSAGTTTISGNSAGTQGGALWIGGNATLTATGGDITFSGNMENTASAAQANAIYLDNTPRPILTAPGATVTFSAAADRSITFFDPIQNNAANGLISVLATGGGTVAFDGSLYGNLLDRWSQLYGTTEVDSGTTFAVRNNAVYGALAADVSQTTPSSFTVDAGATLAGGIAGEVRADNFALNGTLNIAGTSPPGSASGGFSTFTVTSNNVSFGTGSQVLFNTYLNDASVQRTDLLTLNLNGSATSGTANIFVTNVGGPGGLTTGNGIQLVQTNNGTTAGAFTLANPELRAGAFDYRLFQGGPDGSDPDNWYLRSTFIGPPTPPTPGPGPQPIIGPELATYGAVQPMAQQLGRAMLGTHDERLGDLYRVPCEPAETNAPNYTKAPVYTKAETYKKAADCGGWRPAVWGRLFGQQIDNHYQAFADPRASGEITGLQVGVDLLRTDGLIPGHTDYAGLYFAYGNANVDVSGLVTNAAATAFVLQHTGSLSLNAYSGGAYWTHYGIPGWYLDLTLQGTSYSNAASTEFAHLNASGSGFISSLEGGYPIALPVLGPGFVLEPQAQVLWQWVGFDAGNDGLGPVALGTTSTTTARVGLKGKWTITTDSGQVWQPYVRANFWSDFGGTAATLFGPDSIPLISHAQYMDIGGGFTTEFNAHLSGFADAGYQFVVSNDGGGRRNGVKATAGLRYQW